jgi:site-specific DNA-methyltransferase (cytosine-N4-specific)
VDTYTHVWWMAKSDFPKADNTNVLRPYSKSMEQLLSRQDFNRGKRPSGHRISEHGFLKDHGGSIAHNLFEMEPIDEHREVRLPFSVTEFQEKDRLPDNVLSFSNASSNDFFSRALRENGIRRHPATMHPGLVAFFIRFLTSENDLVLDPFAGSNTTGFVAEKLNRRWLSTEINEEYAQQSQLRFSDPELKTEINIV